MRTALLAVLVSSLAGTGFATERSQSRSPTDHAGWWIRTYGLVDPETTPIARRAREVFERVSARSQASDPDAVSCPTPHLRTRSCHNPQRGAASYPPSEQRSGLAVFPTLCPKRTASPSSTGDVSKSEQKVAENGETVNRSWFERRPWCDTEAHRGERVVTKPQLDVCVCAGAGSRASAAFPPQEPTGTTFKHVRTLRPPPLSIHVEPSETLLRTSRALEFAKRQHENSGLTFFGRCVLNPTYRLD